MQIVQKHHTRGRLATTVQPIQPPGNYHFIVEDGRFYHFCFAHPETAARTVATLQASWDEIAVQLAATQSHLKELLATENLTPT